MTVFHPALFFLKTLDIKLTIHKLDLFSRMSIIDKRLEISVLYISETL